jgi:hypothetical protein
LFFLNLSTLFIQSAGYSIRNVVGRLGVWISLIVLMFFAPGLVMAGSYVALLKGPQSLSPLVIVTELFLLMLIGVIILGYFIAILRGVDPAPEVENFRMLFFDGIRCLIIEIIYMIPVVLAFFVCTGFRIPSQFHSAVSGNPSALAALGSGVLFRATLVAAIIAILIELVMLVGIIRFARTGSMSQAFNLREILARIGKIGWLRYIAALVLLAVILIICDIVPPVLVELVLGFYGLLFFGLLWGFILLIIEPILFVFAARYVCLIYDIG